ncbi:MAG: NAD(P)-dependent oxidoreductase [Anaerolineaceae bacterium]
MQSIPGEFLEIDRKKRVYLPFAGLSYRSPTERVCDFSEVVLPFDEERARFEASRCIHCPDPAPCVLACPVHNDIPSAMWLIEHGEFEEALGLYLRTSSFPCFCGRVCPHEQLCQGSCVLSKDGAPVLTGHLEAFVADYALCRWLSEGSVLDTTPRVEKKVAVVGAGPSGLGCANDLAKKGYAVTVFDAMPHPGGLLMYGIPNFKLPRNVIYPQIDRLKMMGVEFVSNTRIGVDKTVDDLFTAGYEAVFIGVGTWVDALMEIPGEDLPGVYRGSHFLVLANSDPEHVPDDMEKNFKIGKNVVVVGGGDTASDCLRTAVRLDTEKVTCIYRRTEAEMPGSKKDRQLAREEGAEYRFLIQPIRFIAGDDGKLAAIECIQNKLGDPDEKGRRRPVPIEGSNFFIEADMAVLAIGYWPDTRLAKSTPGLETKKWGEIIADTLTGATSRPGVFAGGDAVTGPDLVVTAMAAGKRAAVAIDKYLQDK